MPTTRIPLLCLLISSFASPLTAEQNAVTLGKYKVHPTRIIARHAPGVAVPQSTTATLQSLGLTVMRRYTQVPGLIVLDSSKKVALADLPDPKTQAEQLVARILALQNSGLFAYVEADYVVTNCVFPTDAAFLDGTLWGLINVGQDGGTFGADIAASTAWNLTRGSTNVIVAVIDTGIRYTHQDLSTQMWHNPDEVAGNGLDDDNDGYTDDVFGINAITGSGDPFDDNDHGTHVAGTIGAAANNGFPHVGVAWNVSLMACKFLDSEGRGFESDAIACIDFAVKKGARILNNSWGGGPFGQSLFDAIVDARSKGVLFVAAAGNNSDNNDVIPFYPASYNLDNVISVAALDRNDQLADFSNYGRNRVHLGAPGVEIFSTTAGSDSSYDFDDGTSMAAPHVSGVAALILARFTNAPMVEIRERILSTAVPVAGLSGRTTTGGRLNAFRALSATADGILEVYADPPTGSDLLAGSSNTIFVTVSDLLPIRNATVTVEGNTNIVFQNTGRPPDLVSNDNIYSSFFKVPTNVGPLTLTIIASAAGKTNGTNIVVYNVIERPANDNFANAAKVPTGGAFGATLIQATNKLATIEDGEPIHEGIPSRAASVWWDWSPKTSGRTLVDTAGSSFDTLLGVYTGANVSSLVTVASGEDPPGKNQSTLHFDATSGITYHIAVAGAAADQTGTIRLRIELGGEQDTDAPIVQITSPPSGLIITNATDNKVVVAGTAFDPQPNASGVKQVLVQVNEEIASGAFGTTNWSSTNVLQFGENTIRVIASDFAENISAPVTIHVSYRPLDPPNDAFLRAIDLAGTAGSVKASTTNATKEFQEPFHAGNDGGKSVWWRFRSPADGVLFLSTTNSTFDTLLGLYTGDRVNALTSIAGNDDAFEGSQFSKLTQAIHGNQTYYIAVDGYGGRFGLINLDYAFTPTNIFKLTVSSTAGGTVTPSSGMVEHNATIVLSAIPDQNFDFDAWEGSVTSSDNPLSIVVTSDVDLIARFKPKAYSDDFETGSFNRLPYTFSGDAQWLVEQTSTTPGNFAARSGLITNNQSSSLLLNTTSGLGGAASFDFKVSSEKNWDFLEFYVNGTRQQRWSGDVGWLTYQFTLPQGQNALEWRYIKDSTISAGLDAAFMDNLLLPSENPGNVIQARLAMAHVRSGQVQIRVDGEPNQQYIIEASNDLVSWEPISTNVAAQGLIKFVDENSTKYPQRFYRVIAR